MGEKAIVVTVSLLTLVATCGLLVGAIAWMPSRFGRLDARLDRLEELESQIQVMHDRVSELSKLEVTLRETTVAAQPLGRIDASVEEINRKLSESVLPAVESLKANSATRREQDSLQKAIDRVVQKIEASSSDDPELQSLAKDLSELTAVVEANRKSLEATLRDLQRDIKQMQLGLQKIEALISRSEPAKP